MNRKRIALLTSLTVLAGSVINTTNPLRNVTTHQADAAQLKSDLKANQKYPDIMKKLDVTSMAQYASNSLYMNITLKKFYIRDIVQDDQEKTYLLLAPLKSSDQYFLTKLDTNKKLKIGRKITVQGFLNGRVKLGGESTNIGLNKDYLNKKAISIMTDNYSLN